MLTTEFSKRLVVEDALDRIRSAGVPSERREVEWLLQAAEGSSRAGFMASLNEVADERSLRRFEKMVLRRMKHEPVQYILGETEFYGRVFSVTPAVLIPRPETEILVERVIEEAGRRVLTPAGRTSRVRILDAGTGSGCIAVTVALEVPAAVCTAFDVSSEALSVARSNAERLGVDVRFATGDMLDQAPDEWQSAFNILVSNPPYVPDSEKSDLESQVADFEPAAALFTGEDALRYYRGLARLGRAVLAPDGLLIVETHADHAAAVADVFAEAGFREVRVEKDLSGRDRIVQGRL